MLTSIERSALIEAGFNDDELVELNSIKEALETTDNNIERALAVATTGLLYFVGKPVEAKIDAVRFSDTLSGYRINAVSDGRKHAPVALVIIQGGSEDDSPVEIRFGIQLKNEDDCSIKILEKQQFNGNLDLFIPACITFLKLTSYSFFIDDDGEKEVLRSEFYAGDRVTGIIQRPLGGGMAAIDIMEIEKISESTEIKR